MYFECYFHNYWLNFLPAVQVVVLLIKFETYLKREKEIKKISNKNQINFLFMFAFAGHLPLQVICLGELTRSVPTGSCTDNRGEEVKVLVQRKYGFVYGAELQGSFNERLRHLQTNFILCACLHVGLITNLTEAVKQADKC